MAFSAALIFAAAAGEVRAQQGAGLPPPALEKPSVKGSAQAKDREFKPLPPVSITARVEDPEVPRGGTARLLVELAWEEPAGEAAAPLDFEFPDPPSAEGLALYANSFNSSTRLSGSTVHYTRVHTFDFRADQEGQARISPVKVEYMRTGSDDVRELETGELPLAVTEPRPGPGKLASNPAAIAGITLVLLAAAVALAWPVIKGRRGKKLAVEPVLSVHDQMRERLGQVDRLRMAGDYTQFLVALSKEVAAYMQKALGVKARAVPAQRIETEVAQKLGTGMAERVTELFETCNQVKFAARKPSVEHMDRAMETARALVAEAESRDQRAT